ncbi:MAG: oligopeptide transport system ATP-binding protein [Gammaproteobacteria bacterium]|nr:oligopeptide transport system ATP-binding protein [Gammaproteobacteria bacterium]
MKPLPTLQIDNLSVNFAGSDGPLAAVREVSLAVAGAECVGVVGESGSGKTQLFMAAMGLLARNAAVTGSVRFEGNELLGAAAPLLNRFRGSRLSMIFQDPMTSLTPHMRIGAQLAEVLLHHQQMTRREAWDLARTMLERVRIPDPLRRLQQYPHQLSGGMRQRVMIAMSLLCNPALVIADEPTTALDVTVQAQILDLLRTVRADFGMALILISHDLTVVGSIADRILVMYAGRIVEASPAEELWRAPQHPYSAELLKCVPTLSGPLLSRLATLRGQAPLPHEVGAGCAFAPRCAGATEKCRRERPALSGSAVRQVACHFPLSA